MKINERDILCRVLRIGWKTADQILKGQRPMTDGQKYRLEDFNKDAGPNFQIHVPEVA